MDAEQLADLMCRPDEPALPRTHSGIRLVAIDLDGTLLNDSKQISDQTINALRCLPQHGVKVVIASARPPRSVRPFHSQLNLDTLQINYNGALIWDSDAARPFFHLPMTGRLTRRIIRDARTAHADVLVSCEVLDRWYTDRFDETYTTETGRLFRPDVIAPLRSFYSQSTTKILLLGARPMMDSLQELLVPANKDRASVVRCDPELLQIMNAQAGKGAALRMVAAYYDIPMAQVMAIGDAANDVDMLQAAGVSIAMDNAHPRLKEIAHWTAPSNNDHGVLAALKRYGLCD